MLQENTTCIRCGDDLDSPEGHQTGICAECWTPEDDHCDDCAEPTGTCPGCIADGRYLGTLGHTLHFRCRQCGINFYRTLNPE